MQQYRTGEANVRWKMPVKVEVGKKWIIKKQINKRKHLFWKHSAPQWRLTLLVFLCFPKNNTHFFHNRSSVFRKAACFILKGRNYLRSRRSRVWCHYNVGYMLHWNPHRPRRPVSDSSFGPTKRSFIFSTLTRLIRTQLYGHRLIRTMDIFRSPELHVYMYTVIYSQPRFTRHCLTEHRLWLNILLVM